MTLREQVEDEVGHDITQLAKDAEQALHCIWPTMMLRVLDVIDAHRCIDPEPLVRALRAMVDNCDGDSCGKAWDDAVAVLAAYEEQG